MQFTVRVTGRTWVMELPFGSECLCFPDPEGGHEGWKSRGGEIMQYCGPTHSTSWLTSCSPSFFLRNPVCLHLSLDGAWGLGINMAVIDSFWILGLTFHVCIFRAYRIPDDIRASVHASEWMNSRAAWAHTGHFLKKQSWDKLSVVFFDWPKCSCSNQVHYIVCFTF